MPLPHLLLLALAPLAHTFDGSADEDTGPLDGLEYRSIGPAAGGRVARVCGVPGDPLTYWAATAAGGVWKSANGGTTWEPVFDDQGVSSIGAVAVAPSDPNVVWVGTGEANIRGNVAEGDGIHRSTDAGATWTRVWQAEGQVGAIAVHPRDADTAWVAVLGSPFGPSATRGVLRTTDGGATWETVLHVDDDTGAVDVCVDPTNPRVLFAGTWQTRRTPWSLTSGGPGSGLWVSRDAGDSWERLTEGLPEGDWGRVGVRVAPGDPRRVYALIEAEEGGLFRSDDGGETWTLVNGSRGLRQRAWYYSTLTVDPTREDVVWFPQVNLLSTLDGGAHVASVPGGGWDYHDLWIDPLDRRRRIVASDAGVSLTRDGGETWTRPPLPISQFYHLSADTRRPYRVLGSLQDLGTVSGPSDSLNDAGILLSDWIPVGGGEAGHVVAEPDDPDVVWAGEYMGIVTRWDGRLRRATNVSIYPYDASGHAPSDLDLRFQWTAPIVASRHASGTVWHAANVLFETADEGQSWRAISPDLTRDDASKQQWSGGPITGDNTGVEVYGTIFALAESPLAAGLLWAGTDDGLVHVTSDGGATWAEVTPRDLPEWGTVACIEASPHDTDAAWVVVDAHRLDDETPYLWRTADRGATWTRCPVGENSGLDGEVYLHVVRQDRVDPNVLYLGTERGVLVSRDGGDHWESLRLNMPPVAVVDLALAEDDLVVGTLGRSAWILDDLGPVRADPAEYAAAALTLFDPPVATAWRVGDASRGGDDGAGENPPHGALLTYRLAEDVEGELELRVLDAEGRLVRRLSSTAEPPYVDAEHPDRDPEQEDEAELDAAKGVHRVAWDLTYASPRRVPGALLDWGEPGPGPAAPAGIYTVELRLGDLVARRALTVEADPRVDVAPAEQAAQLAFTLEVRAAFERVTDLVLAVRRVREQVAARNATLAEQAEAAQVVAAGRTLVEALDALEATLHNPHAEVGYDILAGRARGAQLHSQLEGLFQFARDHEGPPTQGMRQVAQGLKAVLAEAEREADRLLGEELARLNAAAREVKIPYVVR